MALTPTSNPSSPVPVTTRDGSCTLYSTRYAQTYGSESGALSEAREVFLKNSGVEERLGAGETVRVLEVGFGTGLNFFVTAQACLEQIGLAQRSLTRPGARPSARLHYTALEHTLLTARTVAQLGYGPHVGDDLLASYLSWRGEGEREPGLHVFEFEGVRLELLLGEARTQALPEAHFGAVYHDAFSPEVNPELWHEDFLAKLSGALVPGGTLVSYCVQGAVRRSLRALGLEVGKRPGPAFGKREVLLAYKPTL